MGRKSLVLVVFLLMFYIAPLIFTSSYAHVAIPAEQNRTKDFRLSGVLPEWYNDSWLYRKSITVTGSAGAGTDYQIRLNVTYDSDMQTDFDDLRFTAYDNITEWDYWIEEYTVSTFAVVRVEWRDNLDSNSMGWMYYGNSSCSTTSNGANTFPMLYEDWSTESVRASVWDITSSDGTISWAVGGNHGTVAKIEGDVGGGNIKVVSDFEITSPHAVMFRSNIEDADAGNTQRQGSGYDGGFPFAIIESDPSGNDFRVYDDDVNEDAQPMDAAYFDVWWTFDITRDGTNAKLYADTNLIETASCAPDTNLRPATFFMCGDSENDIYSDWIVVRKYIATEPVFSSFGDEKSHMIWHTEAPAQLWFDMPYWNTVGSAVINFFVPMFTGSIEAWFILLGLIMIPTSTVYLVRGGRDKLSTDKIFFVMVIFFVGCAFFLGGIMP